MRPQLMMFLVFVYLIGQYMSYIAEATWITGTDVSVLNFLTGYNSIEFSGVAGIWAVPQVVSGFFTVGLPRLIIWNFACFSGAYALFRWFVLYPISAGVIWGILEAFIVSRQQR